MLGQKTEAVEQAGLAEAVGQATDAIIITDPDGVIQFVNLAFTAITGYSSKEALGQSPRILKSGRHPEAFYKELWSTIRSGKVWCGELANRRKDGSTYFEEMRIAPIKGPQEEIKGYVAIKRDVTELRAADEARRFLTSIVEASEDAILSYSPSGTILTWNRGAEAIFGYSSVESVGKHASFLVAPEKLPLYSLTLETLLKGESVPLRRGVALHKDGRRIPVSITSTSIRDSSGKIIAISDILRDESMHQKVQDSLQEATERLMLAARAGGVGIFDYDIVNNALLWDEQQFRLFGIPRHRFVGAYETWRDGLHPEDRQRTEEEFNAALRGEKDFDTEFRVVWPDGSIHHLRALALVKRDASGAALRIIGTNWEITAQKHVEAQLRASEERYRTAFQMNLDSVDICHLEDGRFVDVNDAFLLNTGFAREEVLGRTALELGIWANPADRQNLLEVLRVSSACRNLEAQYRTKDGTLRWALMSVSKVELDGVPCILSVTRDITDAKAAEEEIRSLAFYDTLTGVPNRRLLSECLQHAIVAAARDNRKGALLFIDVDHLKQVNDTLGHKAGDVLLQEVARRLKLIVRESDTVGRFAGDEFVVVLQNLGENAEEAAAHIQVIGEKIINAIQQPMLIEGRETRSSCSIGITLFGKHDHSADQIMQQADIAMYQAKAAGRNAVRFFAPALQAAVNARFAMEDDLRRAIRLNQFELYYQPQFDRDQLVGAEALIRWKQPSRGVVPPDEFIPLAEETGLILEIGNWLLETACAQITGLTQYEQCADITVAVNISAREFRQPDFVERVLSPLFSSNVNPRHLKLELTESMLVDNFADVIVKMTELKANGIKFSLDDFGTGYSSLSYLKRLPLDQLKIDRSFVREMLDDETSGAIARTIISLSKAMGLSVIAEGVETEEQREFLAEYGCFSYQGYLFGRPVPFEEFQELCRALPEKRKERMRLTSSGRR